MFHTQLQWGTLLHYGTFAIMKYPILIFMTSLISFFLAHTLLSLKYTIVKVTFTVNPSNVHKIRKKFNFLTIKVRGTNLSSLSRVFRPLQFTLYKKFTLLSTSTMPCFVEGVFTSVKDDAFVDYLVKCGMFYIKS